MLILYKQCVLHGSTFRLGQTGNQENNSASCYNIIVVNIRIYFIHMKQYLMNSLSRLLLKMLFHYLSERMRKLP